MKFLVINGPNLNLLGQREPGIYGAENYESLCARLKDFAAAHGSTVDCFQSNHEGAIVDTIQAANGVYDAMVMNPGAYTHYSLRGGPHLQHPPAGGVPPQERHRPRLRGPDLRPGALRLRSRPLLLSLGERK